MKINTTKKNILFVGFICFILGLVVMFFISREQVQSQKKLTVRILTNAVQSMQAFQKMADSCSDAYDTVTACVSNLKTCNIEAESKKLDEFNTKREQADQQINLINEDMKKIIEDVKASQ